MLAFITIYGSLYSDLFLNKIKNVIFGFLVELRHNYPVFRFFFHHFHQVCDEGYL